MREMANRGIQHWADIHVRLGGCEKAIVPQFACKWAVATDPYVAQCSACGGMKQGLSGSFIQSRHF